MNKVATRLLVVYYCDLIKDTGYICDFDDADISEIESSIKINNVDDKIGIRCEIEKHFKGSL